MKKLFLVIIVLVLVSCNNVSGNLLENLDEYIKDLEKTSLKIKNNNYKKYYNYYIPDDISSINSTNTYNVFLKGNYNILMNLNISSIIQKKLYEKNDTEINDIYDLKYLIYKKNDGLFNGVSYKLNIYTVDEQYLIYIRMNDMNIITLVKGNYVYDFLREMLIIGSSINIDENLVVVDFSVKDVIDYQKESIDLFEMIVPKDGLLEELLDPDIRFSNSENDYNDNIDDDIQKRE